NVESGGKVRARVLIIALGLISQSTMDIGRYHDAAWRRHDVDRRVPRKPQRFGAIGDRPVEIALGAPDHCAVDQWRGQGGAKPDRLIDVSERAIEIAKRLLGVATILIGEGFLGRE